MFSYHPDTHPFGAVAHDVQHCSRQCCPLIKHKKAPCFRMRLVCLFGAWQFPTLAWGDPTLPSALRRFTSEFGMGSGGTTALVPPGIFCFINRCIIHTTIDLKSRFKLKINILVSQPKHLRCCKVKPHGSLVLVSSTYRYAYTPSLSTS